MDCLIRFCYPMSMPERILHLRIFILGIALSLAFVGGACTSPQGDWQVSKGVDYPTDRIREIELGTTTAGEVIARLGSPYGRRTESFVYSVQYTRPVERNFLFYSRPYTEQVTHRTFIGFGNGIVTLLEDKRDEQYLPAGPRR